MLPYDRILSPLVKVPIQYLETNINGHYFDKHDDIVVCNNVFAGIPTDGHIFPKEPKIETLDLLEHTIPSAYIEPNPRGSFSE